jgi:hypothetical protein
MTLLPASRRPWAGRTHWFGDVVASSVAPRGPQPEREEGGYLIDGFTEAR